MPDELEPLHDLKNRHVQIQEEPLKEEIIMRHPNTPPPERPLEDSYPRPVGVGSGSLDSSRNLRQSKASSWKHVQFDKDSNRSSVSSAKPTRASFWRPADRPFSPQGTFPSQRPAHTKTLSFVTLPSSASSAWKQPKPKVRRCHECCAKIVNNKCVVAFTTILTVYALTGDDIRLLATNKPQDIVFNVLTIVCLLTFSVEIVISCIGKDDYFLGFFFGLDVVSTITMVLDLTWVSEFVMGDEDDFDRARSGRTARMGAKVGRVVRVIRLIRIVKLYKAYYESRQKKRKRIDPVTGEEIGPGEDDEDDWGQDDGQNTTPGPTKETHVGKKLSAITTQRVIVLVLTMLLVVPLLMVEDSQQTPQSPAYGADDVYEAFVEMERDSRPRLLYERTMLRYLYYHNWFNRFNGECPRNGESNSCSAFYYTNVFWVGIASNSQALRANKASAAKLRAETVASWESNLSSQDYLYNYGTMPTEVIDILSSPWTKQCTLSKVTHLGISLVARLSGYAVECPDQLRPMERTKWNPRALTLDDYQTWHFAFYFDLRPYTKAESAFNICITLVVCGVLCLASVSFSRDATALVLQPVETMIAKVNMIKSNPLIAIKMADNEFRVEEMNKVKEARMNMMNKEKLLKVIRNLLSCRSQEKTEILETVILDKTIIKLGTLLALGFGEAGANIVSANISNSAGVNAMIEGTRIKCILGNTRINHFSIATEVLQGKVMTFVNQIAEIVHGVIDEFAGAANKNNGETFLLIWRLLAEFEEDEVTKIADMAMMAFASILGAVHRSPVLASYRGHPGLQQRLGQRPRVNLTFGLHQGWAIEGAVGTEYKIDASYLSPHVSITEAVCQAAAVYGVPFVASEAAVTMCTKGMADKCRLIDTVKITGSKLPMCLLSMDLDYMSLEVIRPKPRLYIWNPRQRFRARQLLEAEKNRKWSPEVSISTMFDENPDIAIMRRRYTTEFLQLFNMGYRNYMEGEWMVARRLLSRTQDLLGIQDGPSIALLRFMETPFDFQAPRGWEGVHEFTGRVTADVDRLHLLESLDTPRSTDSQKSIWS